tara:strand:- start:137 stop:406 length:270 start_codon:yes stop_codon:yes gene_type:complete
MFINLSYFEVMEAIDKHLEGKGIKWSHNEYDDTWIEFHKPVWAEKKHKNGKVVKCKHGYPEREIVKWETVQECFTDGGEMRIWYSEEDE